VFNGTGNGGAGGTATATASGSNAGTNSVSVNASATGGNGGQRQGASSTGGVGGDAQATATGSGGGFAGVSATANGGTGSGGSFNGAARADATATGTSGSVTATADSAGGLVRDVHSNTTAPLSGPGSATGVAAARAAVAQPAPSAADASGKQALGYITGLPNAADVNTVLVGNPNAQATFAQPNAKAYGLLWQGGGRAGATGASFTSTATVDLSLDTTQVPNQQNVIAAFLDPTMTTFTSLRFRAIREFSGTPTIDQTFLTTADATAFFNDNIVTVGDWTTGVSADHVLDLRFIFDVASTQAGSSFMTDFLVGNGTPVLAAIPEPSTYVLFSFGLLGIGLITRRRRMILRLA